MNAVPGEVGARAEQDASRTATDTLVVLLYARQISSCWRPVKPTRARHEGLRITYPPVRDGLRDGGGGRYGGTCDHAGEEDIETDRRHG